MKRFAVVLCLNVCSLFLSWPVLAVPINFDFSSSDIVDGLYPGLNLQVSGLQVQIQATDDDNLPQTISKLGTGLGVYSGGSDSKVIDGSSSYERLQLFFDYDVQLL